MAIKPLIQRWSDTFSDVANEPTIKKLVPGRQSSIIDTERNINFNNKYNTHRIKFITEGNGVNSTLNALYNLKNSSRNKFNYVESLINKFSAIKNKTLSGKRIDFFTSYEEYTYKVYGQDDLLNSTKHLVSNNINNIYSGVSWGPDDYINHFFDITESWTSSPTSDDITRAANSGSNLGQLGGMIGFKTDKDYNPHTRPQDLIDGYTARDASLNNSARYLFESITTNSKSRKEELEQLLIEEKNKLVKSYLPGLTRPNQPFLIPAALDDYLDQNLLTPTNNKSELTLFQNLYIRNPLGVGGRTNGAARSLATRISSGIQDPSVFDDGILFDTPLIEIERSGTFRENPSVTPKVFRFMDDSSKLSYEAKIAGFNNNIPGSVKGVGTTGNDTSDVGGELQAVVTHDNRNFTDRRNNRQQKGREQYFPFLFETENRTAVGTGQNLDQMCYFQATLDNIQESYNPAWQQRHYFGRTEQVATYTYTDRTIDISFAIVANNIRQLQNLQERVNWLAQQTYGQYSFNSNGQPNRLVGGSLIRMTIGDMFGGLGGYIQSLSYDWNLLGEGGKWEMTDGLKMPMGCKVQLSFKVLHDDLPSREYNLYPGTVNSDEGIIGDGVSRVNGSSPALIPVNRFDSNYSSSSTRVAQQNNEPYIHYIARKQSVGN